MKKLFLLDGMALVYRAHFAFIARPIRTSKGVNTSALFGFTQTLLDILKNQQPTHIAVAFDTEAPTYRHAEFADYKATRQAMPEDLSLALPHVRRMVEAFRIPVLTCDGFEADDIIGTIARRAEKAGFRSYLVTPDKDFGQLVDENTFLYKPARMGTGVEIMGLPEIRNRWGIKRAEQVVDVLALMGDSVDNIPGVPGIGEKTAMKLIGQFETVENLLGKTGELTGRVKENLEAHRKDAVLSKRLATIQCDAPCPVDLESLKLQPPDEPQLKDLMVEFEFNSLGRRIFGEGFKAGRGAQTPNTEDRGQRTEDRGQKTEDRAQQTPRTKHQTPGDTRAERSQKANGKEQMAEVPASALRDRPVEQLVLISEREGEGTQPPQAAMPPSAELNTITDVPHHYELVLTADQRSRLIQKLRKAGRFCLDLEATSLDPKAARLVGLAFSFEAHTGYYVPITKTEGGAEQESGSPSRSGSDASDPSKSASSADPIAHAAAQRAALRFEGSPEGFRGCPTLEEFRSLLESEQVEIVGHNLKYDLSVLKWHGVSVRGKLFDTMIAHSLVEPELRHGMDYLSEVYLAYTPIPITRLIGEGKANRAATVREPQKNMADVPVEEVAEYAAEDADVTWQLLAILEPLIKQKKQERVFYEIEAPLVPVLADMECEGIKVDAAALSDFGTQLSKEIDMLERTICKMAGTDFNLNSPRQLGQILFDVLKISAAPRKTRTGQYATDEQTLVSLAPEHEIVQRLLEYRAASKLKSTYADALPAAIWPATGRVHTTFNQVMTTTGRLNSQDPNLQNIPIRTERGQEVRKAFVPRDSDFLLMSADYSQIELRIIAALSQERGLLEAFRTGADIHTATAARVYGLPDDLVTAEMRRKAKMVNYGIAYGISAFGLAQRLAIPRQEAASIIELYFKQFPGIRRYMDDTVAFARKHGFVETVTGRRRYVPDIRSLNDSVRSAAERNAINAPIQGTAADMIKIAMSAIHRELGSRGLKTKMLLQVHDELVFDLYKPEQREVRELVEDKMKTAIPLEVPIVVEMGVGQNWLEAH